NVPTKVDIACRELYRVLTQPTSNSCIVPPLAVVLQTNGGVEKRAGVTEQRRCVAVLSSNLAVAVETAMIGDGCRAAAVSRQVLGAAKLIGERIDHAAGRREAGDRFIRHD